MLTTQKINVHSNPGRASGNNITDAFLGARWFALSAPMLTTTFGNDTGIRVGTKGQYSYLMPIVDNGKLAPCEIQGASSFVVGMINYEPILSVPIAGDSDFQVRLYETPRATGGSPPHYEILGHELRIQ